VRDIAMGGSTDADIAAYARENGICLATRDFDFADVRNYPPNKYAGLIVLDLPDKAVSADVCALLTKFLLLPNVEREMAGRLAIVRPERVRFRPKLDS